MSENIDIKLPMPILALRGLVVFPEMLLHFDVGRKKSIAALNSAMASDQEIFLVAQKDVLVDDPKLQDLYKIGIVSRIKQILKLPSSDNVRVVIEGEYRASIHELSQESPFLYGTVAKCREKKSRGDTAALQEALLRKTRELFESYVSMSPKMSPDVLMMVMSSVEPSKLADYIASNIMLEVDDKQEILSELNPLKRLEKLCVILSKENELLDIENDIHNRVQEQVDQNQREYFLREQMKAISYELNESDNPQEEAEEYREKIIALKLGKTVEDHLLGECDKLFKMPSGSHEASVIVSYLDLCLSLPWNKYTKDRYDLANAQKVLDRDHYGLVKVKERIIELLAVRKLSPNISGQIICLYGPPGVGKTSIAKSLAKAMGRKYARISLGGIRDEAEIRGHRKTYIGAMPGRIISAVKQAGSCNALILLDEIDKIGTDYRGDPSSALLEALDPEQNFEFRDHYIEVPFDLSKVLFITTANTLSTIPEPLLDRMEVIELSSYTHEEKFNIAKKHLVPKQIKRHGLNGRNTKIGDDAIHTIIDSYTREAGVRNLEREIATICRKSAKNIVSGDLKRTVVTLSNIEEYLGPKKFINNELSDKNEVGVATGLAWTSAGGETLQIEVAVLEGTGKLELTGSLGDVMKESAHAAVSYVRSRTGEFGIHKEFYKNRDIHIHVPEGAIPKDGPSAGITIATALVSALTNRPVKRDVAMTGEITLRGRVLPIGGLKEKSMAAYRLGIKTIIIPEDNKPDLAEIDPVVLSAVNFVTVKNVDKVIECALISDEEKPKAEKKAEANLPVIKENAVNHNIITQ